MASPFLGQISQFGFNFNPRFWAFCDGQLLSIAQNTALFSLLGTTYGGNGQTTFGLPNLKGRAPMHPGSGPGLTPRTLGESGGVENVTLLVTEMPSHNHNGQALAPACSTAAGSSNVPSTRFAAVTARPRYADAANGTLNGNSGNAGGSQPHENVQPCLVVNFCIALQGIFPSRN